MVTGAHCYLVEPQWREYLREFTPASQVTCILQELIEQVTQWPGFAADIRKLRNMCKPTVETDRLRVNILGVRSRLRALYVVLEEALQHSKHVSLVPSTCFEDYFDKVYEFRESGWNALINMYVGYALTLENMLGYLDELCSPTAHHPRSLTGHGGITEHHRRLVAMACRCFEYTRLRRPLLGGMCTLSLTVSYSYADNDRLQEWILNALNESEAFRWSGATKYTRGFVEFLNKLLVGAAGLESLPSG